jgi:hypothetical protein
MKIRSIILYSLLLFVTPIFAQPRISSNTEKFNFGRIEWKKAVKVEYVITNTGDKPLVMSNVTTSCSCTVADWTKTPINPGDKGTVVATYDAKTLGHFDKEICIYSNAIPHLAYLTFTGEVVREVNDYSKSHPFKIGNIGIDKTSIEFPDSKQGDKLTAILNIVNLSDRPYEPILMHLPSYVTIKRSSDVLLKGQRGSIQLTLDTKQINDVGLTQSSVYLSRFNGDKVSSENEIPISFVLLPDFSKMTKEERSKAPTIHLSSTSFNLSNELAKEDKVTKVINIFNSGKSPLVITKVQVFNTAIGVALHKKTIPPAESTVLKITVRKKDLNNKDNNKIKVLMITNDPSQPKVEINIQTKKQ